MLVVGLTGGIGSGKTTVANLFAARGVTLIDTDHIAREVIQPGQNAYHHIIEKFGREILLPDNTIHRAKMRKIIFTQPALRLWLENLLHPLIRQEIEHQIQQATSPYVIVIIPLLVETRPNPLIHRILVVDASEDHQLARAQARDQTTAEEIAAILKTQVSREKRLLAADDIIHNHGSLDELIPQVDQLHQFYLSQKTY